MLCTIVSVPELLSEEVIGDLGSGLNMLASGLIWALSCGAGGGTMESTLFWNNNIEHYSIENHSICMLKKKHTYSSYNVNDPKMKEQGWSPHYIVTIWV